VRVSLSTEKSTCAVSEEVFEFSPQLWSWWTSPNDEPRKLIIFELKISENQFFVVEICRVRRADRTYSTLVFIPTGDVLKLNTSGLLFEFSKHKGVPSGFEWPNFAIARVHHWLTSKKRLEGHVTRIVGHIENAVAGVLPKSHKRKV